MLDHDVFGAAAMRARMAFVVGSVLVVAAALALDRSPPIGQRFGNGYLVADESVYPGDAGPLLGDVVTSQQEADRLWDTVGFETARPHLDGDAVVVVTGGQPRDCRWRLDDVSVGEGVVRVTLAFASRWRNMTPVRATWCDGNWEPRALAVTVPAGDVADGDRIEVVLPWQTVETAAPVAEGPDPDLWTSRALSSEELEHHFGCEDAVVVAKTAEDAVVVWARWPGAASEAFDHGLFEARADLPDDEVTMFLQVGGHASAWFCTDIVKSGRPMPTGRWHATSGQAHISVELDETVQPHAARATLTLRNVRFEPSDRSADGTWWIEQLVVPDVHVGWYAG